ncbi:MAG: hypothetical protein D6715_04700 [Calditrichaeota bacterium]|nr:MAG: hypothetical protein D6715_04700 [Calditrichota bacterium]
MKNIILIAIDCARAEKTIMDLPHGNEWTRRSAPLPFLEQLRCQGVTWGQFHSVSSTTTPNFTSMLTGLLPVEHGIKEHSRYQLLPDVPTLAEILSRHGYYTYAEVSGPLIPETGLNRGFMHYHCRSKSEYLHKGFLPRMKQLFGQLQEPFFLLLHFWEAHQPYQNPAPFNETAYGATPYDRALSFIDHFLFHFFNAVSLPNTSFIYTGDHGERLPEDYQLNRQLGGKEYLIAEAYREFVHGRSGSFDYDAWFEFVKARLGEDWARIYAHNFVGHGFHLTEELIRVPLVIVDPDRCTPGSYNDELRSQIDLFPTILELAGIDSWQQYCPRANSLFQPARANTIYIEANGSGGKQFASRCYLRGAKTSQWKYWRLEAPGMEKKVLWNLESDPRETTNVVNEHPEVAEKLDAFVSEQLLNDRTGEVDLDSEEAAVIEERLRDLGYIE